MSANTGISHYQTSKHPINSEEMFGCLESPPRTPPESNALSAVESPNTTTGATRRGVWLHSLPNTPNTPNTAVFGCLETPPRDPFKEALARQPQACPSCGSREIAPTFVGRQWDCATCAHTWED